MAYTRNPTWKDWPDQSTPITAAALERIEAGVQSAAAVADGAAPATHSHDDRYYTEAEIDALITASTGTGDMRSAVWSETTFTYPARPAVPMVIWRGPVDPRSIVGSGFSVNVDLWAPNNAAVPDTTPPVAGTLSSSSVTTTSFTLTATGASDDVALHGTPYRFTTDNGVTWSAWQASNVFAVTTATTATSYVCRHEVRDAVGLSTLGAAIGVTTLGGAAWTPASLTGLRGWWDASDATTITATSGAVSEWRDKSGGANHLSPNTTPEAPTTGVRTINGLNVLDFDGGDFLRRLAVLSPALPQPFSAFVVAQLDTNVESVIFTPASASVYAGYLVTSTFRATAGTILDSGYTFNTSAHLHGAIFNGATSAIRIDGTQVASGAMGANAASNLVVGGSSSGGGAKINGAIAEVILVSGAVTGSDLTSIENYLKSKWGII